MHSVCSELPENRGGSVAVGKDTALQIRLGILIGTGLSKSIDTGRICPE